MDFDVVLARRTCLGGSAAGLSLGGDIDTHRKTIAISVGGHSLVGCGVKNNASGGYRIANAAEILTWG